MLRRDLEVLMKNPPKTLPRADEISGMYLNPNSEMVEMQYKSDNDLYVVEIPLGEILKSENWFIQLRHHISGVRRYGPFDDITD